MRIAFTHPSNDLLGIRQRLSDENILSSEAKDADVVISREVAPAKRTFSLGLEIPLSILEAVGLPVSEEPAIGFVTKVWKGKTWVDEQSIMGVEIQGLMDGDLGPEVSIGAGVTYEKCWAEELFYKPEVIEVLESLKFEGFMSFSISEGGGITKAQTGVPGLGIYAVLEGVNSDLGSWLLKPRKLMESWAVSLLVSRAPWPSYQVSEKASVVVPSNIGRHFWGFGRSDLTMVGVSSAWGFKLHDAAQLATTTAKNVIVARKQHRLDLEKAVIKKWVQLKELL